MDDPNITTEIIRNPEKLTSTLEKNLENCKKHVGRFLQPAEMYDDGLPDARYQNLSWESLFSSPAWAAKSTLDVGAADEIKEEQLLQKFGQEPSCIGNFIRNNFKIIY